MTEPLSPDQLESLSLMRADLAYLRAGRLPHEVAWCLALAADRIRDAIDWNETAIRQARAHKDAVAEWNRDHCRHCGQVRENYRHRILPPNPTWHAFEEIR
jgi:hypothetical protein